MKTLNEKVKDLVKNVILDSDYEELQDRSKDVEKDLETDEKYLKLKKAVSDYRLSFYAKDKEYQEISKKVLYTAFRACSKCINEIKIPFDYVDSDKILRYLSESNIANTDSRISSLICKTNEEFSIKIRKWKHVEYIPYTISEIRKLIELINLGILEKETVRQQIKNGKIKR